MFVYRPPKSSCWGHVFKSQQKLDAFFDAYFERVEHDQPGTRVMIWKTTVLPNTDWPEDFLKPEAMAATPVYCETRSPHVSDGHSISDFAAGDGVIRVSSTVWSGDSLQNESQAYSGWHTRQNWQICMAEARCGHRCAIAGSFSLRYAERAP